ncbi:hypothetical protein BTH42_04205 [Burkholderia sp. SRS-W-2-2016]|uniref:hypothetical protein n=1 Tax=Burkholderia sp. SRS-W-2-2016 TaxID=1926878 RepID=UPI00094ADF5A|nr:hypothetical protein [Burkholderia sp. SRS-W-2-2016]OLL33148.1 hypothetical protein BTH42_04205 [Burkholderia sp. SRS-W-2-2016]
MILRESQWEFVTSAGAGIGFDSFTADAGMFVVRNRAGLKHQYKYSGFGPGFTSTLTSLLRIPKFALPKIVVQKGELGGAGATSDFDAAGKLYLTSSFKGADIENPKSLEGGTMYLEGAAGYLFGGTGSFMLLGVNRYLLMFGIVRPEFIGRAIQSAAAALVMASDNAGLQNSIGFSFKVGQIAYSGLYPDDPGQ